MTEMYAAVEDKGDGILFIHFQYEELEMMRNHVMSWESITGRKLIITKKVADDE